MYLDMYNIYIQLGYLVRVETSITIYLPPLKTNKVNTTKQTASETFPLVEYISFVNCKMHHVMSTGDSRSFLGSSWRNKTGDVALSMREGVPAHAFWTLSGASIPYASLARTQQLPLTSVFILANLREAATARN